jgi:uncharacterized membrane protein YhaH (DUF805 family)
VLTNSREVAGFFLARAIVVAIYFVAMPLLLTPLYMELFRSGGAILVGAVTTGVSVATWLVTLLLFLALRAGFGGVPPSVAGHGRRDAMTSSGAEIAAFVIAALIMMVALWAFTVYVLAGIYASLRQSGQMALVLPISIGVSAVSAVVFFLIFIALRGAMSPPVSADGQIEIYDDGGESMGFGKAIATCFRKYAVFSGRASRSEYWFFVLFQLLLLVALMILDGLVFRGAMAAFTTLAWLLLILPGFAVTVRRLHDIDMSGWCILIAFVPLLGSIFLLVWTCQRGTQGPNRFGTGPVAAAVSEVFA